MNTTKRIAKNAIVLYLSHFISLILGLFLSILIARTLGDETFGTYSFAIAFTAIFAVFSDLGCGLLLVREVAKDKSKANKYLSNVLTIRLLLCSIVLIVLVVTVNLMHFPSNIKILLYIFAIYNLLIYFAKVFRTIFLAFEKMQYSFFTNITVNIMRISLGIMVLFFGYGLIELALVFLISGIVDVLLSFLFCIKNFVKPKLEIDISLWKSTLKAALPIGMASIFGMIYVRIDTVMLSMIKGDAVVGWYSAAYNLTFSLTFFPDLFMNALFPSIAIFFATSSKSLKVVYEKSFRYLFILGFPLAVGITLLADKIILLLYGQQFVNSIIALQILAWDVLLIFLYRCVYYVLVSADKQKQILFTAGLCALVNIGLNMVLIPRFSYIGAGIATIITELVLFIILFYIASKIIYRLQLHKIIIKPIIAGGLMGILIYTFSEVNLFIIIIISILFYLTLLYAIRGISRDDIELLKNIFAKKEK